MAPVFTAQVGSTWARTGGVGVVCTGADCYGRCVELQPAGSTHTVSEQNAAGCNSPDCNNNNR